MAKPHVHRLVALCLLICAVPHLHVQLWRVASLRLQIHLVQLWPTPLITGYVIAQCLTCTYSSGVLRPSGSRKIWCDSLSAKRTILSSMEGQYLQYRQAVQKVMTPCKALGAAPASGTCERVTVCLGLVHMHASCNAQRYLETRSSSPGAACVHPASIHRRLLQVVPDERVRGCSGVCEVAAHLRAWHVH
jgi:hypothetical protein